MKKRGFTLVELSIVFVIMGLLISAILVGQSLIESARHKAQIRQFQQYDIAIGNFYNKIRLIPGDSSGWGNKNGILEANGTTPISQLWVETWMFFPELSIHKMITENYAYTPGVIRYGEGSIVPRAKIGRGGIFMQSNTSNQLFYILGAFTEPYSGAGVGPYGHSTGPIGLGMLSPAEAFAIDKKIDDGNPLSGNVVAIQNAVNFTNGGVPYPMTLETNWVAGCVNNSQYNTVLSSTSLCRLLVKVDFDKSRY